MNNLINQINTSNVINKNLSVHKRSRRLFNMFFTATIVVLAGFSNANAVPMDLSDIPLFLKGSTPPAVALSMDTSPDTRNAYIFKHDALLDDISQGGFPSSKNFIPAYEINKLYYQPYYEYQIPVDHNGDEFNSGAQTSFGNAYEDGFTTSNTVNLECEYRVVRKFNSNGTQDYSGDAASCQPGNGPNGGKKIHAFYVKWSDVKRDADGNPILDAFGNEIPVVPSSIHDATADQVLDDTNYVSVNIFNDSSTDFDDFQNFAIWYSYYKSRNMLIRSSATIAFHDMANNGNGLKLAWQSFKNNVSFEVDMFPLRGTHKEAFWAWLLGLKPSGSSTLIPATNEAGLLFKKPQTYWPNGVGSPGDELTCQQNFHVILSGARDIGNSDPLGNSKTLDSSLKVPALDLRGIGYAADDESSIYYDSGTDKGFADYAYHYWANDLMPIKNDVPQYLNDQLGYTDAAGIDYEEQINNTASLDIWDLTVADSTIAKKIFWNNYNDPANWQHMVNFVISLGIGGNKDIENIGDYRHLRDNLATDSQSNWRIDDDLKYADSLQHGAVNSRGEYILAYTPQELIEAFQELISRLLARKSGSSAASTVSANIITENTKVFKTSFDTRGWSGSVVAQSIGLDGEIGAVEWDAGCLLTGGLCGALGGEDVGDAKDPVERNIYFFDGTTLKTFNLSNLSTAGLLGHISQSEILQPTVDVNGDIIPPLVNETDLINYLRGDRSEELKTIEGETTGAFRKRRSVLGDVIHSSAKVVRGPSESYIDDAFPASSGLKTGDERYSVFKTTHAERQNVLLVGANDGMLHAFDAETGVELWAVIPTHALSNMHLLADPDYEHQNFVDSSPTIRDVYINNTWKTVAVGGLRLGGQGFYAIDITNPLAPKGLWEFSDGNDVDMGYSYGEAFITRLDTNYIDPDDPSKNVTLGEHENKWVALLPNGYNSTETEDKNGRTDVNVGSGKSVMFMVNMEDGTKITKFEGEPEGLKPNGMASAAVSDIPYNISANTAFFGDLEGSIYRVDLTDSDFPKSRMVASIESYKTSITSPVRLTQYQNFSNRSDDIMVHYGTGKFIEDEDKLPDSIASTTFQYLVGVFDRGHSELTPLKVLSNLSGGDFVEQTIETETDALRTVSNNPVVKGDDKGWFMRLAQKDVTDPTGERIFAKMATRASAHFLIFSTYLPTGGNACSSGGASWVMVVDNRTGGQPQSGSILNSGTADGMFVDNQVFGVTPIGFAGGGGEILIISTDSDVEGGGDNAIVIPDFTWRRRSWHRMFQN